MEESQSWSMGLDLTINENELAFQHSGFEDTTLTVVYDRPLKVTSPAVDDYVREETFSLAAQAGEVNRCEPRREAPQRRSTRTENGV